ncbi:MAG: cation-translocating P-type ATPase [Euryarchaeota archaeon]|nr:cation-translocating P-type ATPase [Euryarchaeota archaeon]
MVNEIKDFEGLSEKQVAEKIEKEGYNELPSTTKRSIFAIAFEVVREPMFLLLIAAGTLYLFLGEKEEAVMLLGFVFVIIGITLYQERKTERALEALRDLSSPRALVIRDGQQKRIPGREVVRDDILVISEGDRVPADAVILSSSHLSIDESLLTGESAPVRKLQWDGSMQKTPPGGDDLPFIYSGTLVVGGQGIAKVLEIGMQTEMGKIGKALQTLETEDTLLQKETRKFVKNLAIVGFILCAIVVVGYGLTRMATDPNSWVNGFLAGITLAMAILPEEFPVVLTIFLALGAWRLSKNNALARRIPAIETLGAATVLCVDKTGTLTMNRMSVRKIYTNGKFHNITEEKQALPEAFHELVEFGILASKKEPFDPMEKALKQIGDTTLANTEHIHKDWVVVQEYPLSRELLAMSQVMNSPDGKEYVIAAKGAPEAIADLCHFNKKQMQELSKQISSMAAEGLRIIGVAKAYFKKTDLPDQQHDFKFECLGLIGFVDPVRPSVPEAVAECYAAGMRVIMITGDYPGTAQSIAKEIGLKNSDSIMTGPELNAMNDEELQQRIRNVNVCARVVPEQKLRIVNALKENGEIVAMTGDGVNDAPALKSAHIGIAMGGRGTDVARESSSLVLLDDDFSFIVQAVRMGRRIYDNIKKAMSYIIAVHIPIAGISVIPILFNWPLILFPVHVVFLELVIDPACSVAFEAEPEESDVMKRPPRNAKEPLFNKRTLAVSFFQGFSVLFILIAVYFIAIYRGQSESYARALIFTTLVIANLGLIFTNRSWSRTIVATLRSKNNALWIVTAAALIFLGLVLFVPSLLSLFKFSALHLMDIAFCFVAGIVSVIWFEILKFSMQRRKKRQSVHQKISN